MSNSRAKGLTLLSSVCVLDVRQTEGHTYSEDLSENLKLQIRTKKEREKEGGREAVIVGSYVRTGGSKRLWGSSFL